MPKPFSLELERRKLLASVGHLKTGNESRCPTPFSLELERRKLLAGVGHLNRDHYEFL